MRVTLQPFVRRENDRRLGQADLAQHQALRCEQVPPRVALVAPARAASADLPSWRIVPARRAPHVHAVGLEVQDGIVASKPADQLSETPNRSDHDAGRVVVRDVRGRRELLGIVGHHGTISLVPSFIYLSAMTPLAPQPFRCPCLGNIKRYATIVRLGVSSAKSASYREDGPPKAAELWGTVCSAGSRTVDWRCPLLYTLTRRLRTFTGRASVFALPAAGRGLQIRRSLAARRAGA